MAQGLHSDRSPGDMTELLDDRVRALTSIADGTVQAFLGSVVSGGFIASFLLRPDQRRLRRIWFVVV